ncbi:MAG: extracellular solute-binding protein [Lachnospiraceae bacterium]|nr:extracellular solute-binding protein [Lachnospiraceae bacterium]
MKQKVKIRKIMLLVILTTFIVWMTGCRKDEVQDPLNTTVEMSLHLYQYTQVNEVSDLTGANAFFQAMKKTEDGFSILYVDGEGNLAECYTADGGATWDKQVAALDLIEEGNWGFFSRSDMNEAGEYAVLVDGYQVVYINGSGSSVIAENNEGVNSVRFNAAGDAILISTDHKVEEYGVDGRLIRSYPVTNTIDMCFTESEIFFLTLDAIKVYDEASGELVLEDSAVNEYLSEDLQNAYDRSKSWDIYHAHEVMRADGNGAVTLLLDSGMYRYVVGSSVIECIYRNRDVKAANVGGTLSFVQDGEMFYLLGYLENDNTLYFLCCSESDEVVAMDENLPHEEITIYTLYSQEYLEETVRQFEDKYPNITVNIEVGREEGSNITFTEAVNSLNTQLLAGNGPDIILMDDLNYAAYRDSGMLAELSGLYDEILRENPECNTTFLSCYRGENGEIYAIPSQFGVTMISAPSDSMDSLNSLEGLAEYIQNSPCPNPEYGNDLNIYDVTGLFQTLYPAYSYRIFGNGESYDRQELEKFVSGFKEVWDALMEHTTDEQIRSWESSAEQVRGVYYNVADRSYGLVDVNYYYGLYVENRQAESGRSIGLYNFNYYSDIFYLIYITREYQHETYDVFAYDDVKTFTPLMVYSINAKSENMDTAELFIKYMLSTEVQSKIAMGYYIGNGEHPYGMPVNMRGLLDIYQDLEEAFIDWQEQNPGMNVFLDGEQEYYMSVLDSLSVPTYRNAILEEKIRLNLQRYLDDEITLEQYMEEVDNEITLYMEE